MAVSLKKSDTLIIDCRKEVKYNLARVPGAVNVPPGSQIGEAVISTFEKLNPSTVFLYCDGQSCGASENVARQIEAIRPDISIFIMADGWLYWVEGGFPVEKTPLKISKES